jgi:protein SCO1/2
MRTWLASIAAAALGAAALAWATDGGRAFTAETARRLAVSEHPIAVPDLRLQLQTGAQVRLRRLEGELVVATFIYTRCRTMCPMLGVRMAAIRDQLPDGAVGEQVHLLSLSFDPARDTPRRLREYGARYGADPGQWWVARPAAGMARFLDTLGVVVLPDGDGGFRHNAAFYLIDRAGRLVAIIDDDKPDEVVSAVKSRL